MYHHLLYISCSNPNAAWCLLWWFLFHTTCPGSGVMGRIYNWDADNNPFSLEWGRIKTSDNVFIVVCTFMSQLYNAHSNRKWGGICPVRPQTKNLTEQFSQKNFFYKINFGVFKTVSNSEEPATGNFFISWTHFLLDYKLF